MTGFLKVDTADLARLAERVRLSAAEARAASADPAPLRATIGRLGDPNLVRAAAEFLGRWSDALADIVHDARRLADAVDLVAKSYSDAESAAAHALFLK
jgi:hypothetical protein